MSKGRKAFGPSKKKSCDTHHCKKKKQAKGSLSMSGRTGLKHLRVNIEELEGKI